MECVNCDFYEQGVVNVCTLLGVMIDILLTDCDLVDDDGNYNDDSEMLERFIEGGK